MIILLPWREFLGVVAHAARQTQSRVLIGGTGRRTIDVRLGQVSIVARLCMSSECAKRLTSSIGLFLSRLDLSLKACRRVADLIQARRRDSSASTRGMAMSTRAS